MPRICDYEGSRYRTEFWESGNRTYEDQVERVAMRKLLPAQGERLIEVGAGFGRLADLYQGYHQVVLTDYARSQLEEARQYLGQDSRFIYVVADVYNLPFTSNSFDTLTMIRVMHHLTDIPPALAQLHRIIRPEGIGIIEHANKLNAKAITRWLLRRQEWSPFEHTPIEFVELNFNFHPAWMRKKLEEAGFRVKNIRTLSHYRLNLLKRLLPVSWLVKLDSWAQPTGNWWQFAPSVFLQVSAQKPPATSPLQLFRCPTCHSHDLVGASPLNTPGHRDGVVTCTGCQRRWLLSGGIYDFRTPL